jgi:hypothetical protein
LFYLGNLVAHPQIRQGTAYSQFIRQSQKRKAGLVEDWRELPSARAIIWLKMQPAET